MSGDFSIDTIFKISAVDPDGKKFDRVSRVVCEGDAGGENLDMSCTLDVNTEIFPVKVGQKMNFLLTSDVGAPADEVWRPNATNRGIIDKYEYVMYGRLFKLEEVDSDKMAIIISFGGLLLRLVADPRQFSQLFIGNNLYLLLRNI